MIDTIANALASNPSRAQLRTLAALRRTQHQLQYRHWWHLPKTVLELRIARLLSDYSKLALIDSRIALDAATLSTGLTSHFAQRAALHNVGFNRRFEPEHRFAGVSRFQPISDLVAQDA